MASKLKPPALVMHGLLLALLAFLYAGDLLRLWRATHAEVALLTELPSLPLSLVGVAVLLGGAGLLAFGLATGRDASWRGYRLGPVAGVALLFFDFAVLSSVRAPLTAEQRVLLALSSLAEGAAEHASHLAVPDEPRLLQSFVDEVGPAPLFRQGDRVEKWTVEVRRGCTGPLAQAPGVAAGTLVYCVAGDGRTAWITAVALPLGQVFGAPAVVSTADPWAQLVTVPPPPAPPDPEPQAAPSPELDVWQTPTPDEAPDSGR